jgi:1-acyl-sn-glycerol-3-phosphate acyltransferase
MDPFKDIRPYTDSEVDDVLQSLVSNSEVLKALIGLQYPGLISKFPFIKFFTKQKLINHVRTIHTIDDYQKIFKNLMEKVVQESISNFTVNGVANLKKDESYLFISNHRDISLDAALLALNLYRSGYKTFNIAVGNNLMEETWVSDLFRLNKSFIIQRSGGSKKQIYSGLSLASQFIYKSIFQDNDSVWIAQKQGRAKDGIDETDPTLLKMIHMTERKSQSIADYFNALKVVPVSISYEFDPNDQLKAKEIFLSESNSEYIKEKDEDLRSIANGITGLKGNVTINLAKPMTFVEDDDYSTIAKKITDSIVTMYKLHGTNYAAYKLLGLVDAHVLVGINGTATNLAEYPSDEIDKAKKVLEERMSQLEKGACSKFL